MFFVGALCAHALMCTTWTCLLRRIHAEHRLPQACASMHSGGCTPLHICARARGAPPPPPTHTPSSPHRAQHVPQLGARQHEAHAREGWRVDLRLHVQAWGAPDRKEDRCTGRGEDRGRGSAKKACTGASCDGGDGQRQHRQSMLVQAPCLRSTQDTRKQPNVRAPL